MPNPERDTLLLAAAGAAMVLGPDHSATQALARASITMTKADMWHARLALKTLRVDQREAIAELAVATCGTLRAPADDCRARGRSVGDPDAHAVIALYGTYMDRLVAAEICLTS